MTTSSRMEGERQEKRGDNLPADDLGRSYGELLSEQVWEVDAGEPSAAGSRDGDASSLTAAPPPLLRIVEALLFVGGAPLTASRAGEAIRGLTEPQFLQHIDTLNRAYRQQGRPYAIQSQGQGYVLTLRPRFRSVLERLHGGPREARLSPAALDVLALVAYRQPATKQEIDGLRGAESGALLRQLVRRSLINVAHRGDGAQREVSYGTTPRFLELFQLRGLEDLPQTQDLQRL
jgi:segregation and condensation protein B